MKTLLNWASQMVEDYDDFGYLLKIEIEKVVTDDIEIKLTDTFKYTINAIIECINEEIEFYDNEYSYNARGYFNTLYDIERLQWCKNKLQDLLTPPSRKPIIKNINKPF